MQYVCCICGKKFRRYPSKIRDQDKPYCSRACANRDPSKRRTAIGRNCSRTSIYMSNVLAIKKMFE